MELFAAKGLEATTVAEIRAVADVAHKTFFNYFPTKQHLLTAIAEQSLDTLLSDMAEVRAGEGSVSERIRALFDHIGRRSADAGPMHRELLVEIIHVGHVSGSESEQARRLYSAFRAFIDEGVESGELVAPQGIDTSTEIVVGAFYAIMFNWAHLDDYPLLEHARAAACFVTDAMAAPAKKSARTGKRAKE